MDEETEVPRSCHTATRQPSPDLTPRSDDLEAPCHYTTAATLWRAGPSSPWRLGGSGFPGLLRSVLLPPGPMLSTPQPSPLKLQEAVWRGWLPKSCPREGPGRWKSVPQAPNPIITLLLFPSLQQKILSQKTSSRPNDRGQARGKKL